MFEATIVQNAIFTIVSNNYLHYARTLLQSAAIHHPECLRYCVVVDKDTAHAELFVDEFEIIRLADLGLPEPARFLFRYTILELNTAVKPWAIAHLFEKGHPQVAYIDPDIRLYRPMREVFGLLEHEADIVLTPHLLAPMNDDREPSELTIRRAGTYNLGFCALARTKNAAAFLSWWQDKLVYDCVVDQARGIFVDQSWVDLVPGLFTGVAILRHPGYNVAYWNLAQRALTKQDDQWMVGASPLVFFHFSGFDAERPAAFSKHQDRFTLGTVGAAAALAIEYSAALIANGARKFKPLPYGYGTFNDQKTRIPDVFRRVYREDPSLQAVMGNDPFARPEILTTAVDAVDTSDVPITYALFSLWSARADLRGAFLLSDSASLVRFYEWFIIEGGNDFSRNVIDAHRILYKRVNAGISTGRGGSSSVARTGFVRQMYFTILGRDADTAGLRSYEKAAAKRLGSLRVLAGLLLSAESRKRSSWRGRALRAGRVVLSFVLSPPTPPSGTIPTAITPRPLPDAVPCWWTDDVDVDEHGCWVGPSASLWCQVDQGGSIEVEGVAFATRTRRRCAERTPELALSLGGQTLATRILDFDGPFTVCIPIPAGLSTGPALLGFECAAFFMPKDIADTHDDRKLSWRALRISAGGDVLLDHRRKPPLLPVESIVGVRGVNVVGYVAAESGVGESARSFAKGCRAAGIPCQAIDVGYQNRNRQDDASFVLSAPSAERFRFNVLHVNADQTPDTLQAVRHDERCGDVNIAYWHWEQPTLPDRFLPSFEGLDEVWVPSTFVQNAVSAISPLPVFKVPHVIEFTVTATADRSNFGLPRDLFLALTIYDFDSYQYRKNPQAAVEMFRQVARTHANVGLVIKTINGDRHPNARRELQEAIADVRNVFCIDAYLSRSGTYELENVCDCLISLHRSEGFGLALAEMMFLGKPVVGTAWSGNMEFMNAMNSMPVDYELKPLSGALGVYEAGQYWAEADIDHAAAALRQLIDDHAFRTRIGGRARAHMLAHHSAATIGRAYTHRLGLLASRRL